MESRETAFGPIKSTREAPLDHFCHSTLTPMKSMHQYSVTADSPPESVDIICSKNYHFSIWTVICWKANVDPQILHEFKGFSEVKYSTKQSFSGIILHISKKVSKAWKQKKRKDCRQTSSTSSDYAMTIPWASGKARLSLRLSLKLRAWLALTAVAIYKP